MFPPRSLRAIALTFIAAISLATMLTGGAVYFSLVGTIDRQVDKRLSGEAAELLADAPGEQELARRIVADSHRRDTGDIGFLLRNGRGQRVAGNIRLAQTPPPGFSTLHRNAGIAGFTRGRALTHALPGGGTLTLAAESEPIDNHDSHRLLILSLGFGTILLLVIGGTVVLSLAIRRNIEAVRTAAEAIVDGDMRARVSGERAGSAFGRQADAFNRMLDRIGELMDSLAGMSNDIAHDLRTPLARLHGRLAALASAPRALPVRAELEDAVAESEQILAMFAAILRITEVEGGDRRERFESLPLEKLAEDTAESLDAMVEESGRSLRLGPWESARIQGDARLLKQLVVNLVENAVTHTPPGSIITVRVRIEEPEAVLEVQDDGLGIAEADRPLALRRFGRLEKSRNHPGHGLGLPLALAITRLHHGSLELADAAPGLIVRVRLPILS